MLGERAIRRFYARRQQRGGWAREVTQADFAISETAGVNMRLGPGGVRELHWHQKAEWAMMTKAGAGSRPLAGRLPSVETSSTKTSGSSRPGCPTPCRAWAHGAEFVIGSTTAGHPRSTRCC